MYYFSTTKTGYSHIANHRPCDDSVICRKLTNNVFFAAVSDGAGTARLSSLGSNTITNALALTLSNEVLLKSYLPPKLSNCTLDEIIEYLLIERNKNQLITLINDIAHKNISNLCRDTNSKRNEFSCTLVCCFVKNEHEIVAVHIGDGFISVYNKHKESAEFLSKSDNIGRLLNRTYFITSQNSEEHTRVTYYNKPFDNILISTDGLNKFFDNNTIVKKIHPGLANADISEDYDLYYQLFDDYDKKAPEVVSDDCGIILLCKEDTHEVNKTDTTDTFNKESASENHIESLSVNTNNTDFNELLTQLSGTNEKRNVIINNFNVYFRKPSRKELKAMKKQNNLGKHKYKKGRYLNHETDKFTISSTERLPKSRKSNS